MLKRAEEPRYTYGDYVQWQGDDRWELIDGIAFDMSPAPSRLHQDVVFGVGRQLADQVEGSPCSVYLAPFDVRLPEEDEADDKPKQAIKSSKIKSSKKTAQKEAEMRDDDCCASGRCDDKEKK